MKKIAISLLCFCLILFTAACGNATAEKNDDPAKNTENNESTQVANPFIDCETMADAAAVAGFEMVAPESVEGYPETHIQAIEGEMVQVFYGNDSDNVLMRKALGSEDISGDYNEYETTEVVACNGADVTLSANGDAVFVGTWVKDAYTYAVHAAAGTDKETMLQWIGSVD